MEMEVEKAVVDLAGLAEKVGVMVAKMVAVVRFGYT